MTDFLRHRSRFPLFSERSYFATQCLGPVPEDMWADFDAYRRSITLRSRAIYDWIDRLTEMKGLLEQLLGGAPDSVAIKDTATAGQAAIAAAVQPDSRRNRILFTRLDFHSSRYMWRAQERRGFDVVELSPENGTAFEAEEIIRRIDERVAIVAVALVSPRTGALLDIAPIARRAREVGALLVIDAYQAVGVVPLDVVASDFDVVIGGTHKWLSGAGTGLSFLYVRPALAESLLPAYPGWHGHQSLEGFEEEYRPAPGATRFQQGSVPIEPIYTSRAGIKWVLETGVAAIGERSRMLANRLIDGATAAGIRVLTPRADARHAGMVCFDVKDAAGVVEALAELGIDADSRPGAGLRAAAHACLSERECDRLVDAIAILTSQ